MSESETPKRLNQQMLGFESCHRVDERGARSCSKALSVWKANKDLQSLKFLTFRSCVAIWKESPEKEIDINCLIRPFVIRQRAPDSENSL